MQATQETDEQEEQQPAVATPVHEALRDLSGCGRRGSARRPPCRPERRSAGAPRTQPPTARIWRPQGGGTALSDPGAYAERSMGRRVGTAAVLPADRARRRPPGRRGRRAADRLGGGPRDLGPRNSTRCAGSGSGGWSCSPTPTSNDPDRLLVAAQMNTAWWAADDYYADSTEAGADPTLLPPAPGPRDGGDGPGAAGRRSHHRPRRGPARRSRAQDAEFGGRAHGPARHRRPRCSGACYATFSMFVSWNAYGAWREAGTLPPAGSTSRPASTTASTRRWC